MVAKNSQRSMLEGGVRIERHMGHVGLLTCEEEAQAFMQVKPNMWPQGSETGFSALEALVNCSMHMLQLL